MPLSKAFANGSAGLKAGFYDVKGSEKGSDFVANGSGLEAKGSGFEAEAKGSGFEAEENGSGFEAEANGSGFEAKGSAFEPKGSAFCFAAPAEAPPKNANTSESLFYALFDPPATPANN